MSTVLEPHGIFCALRSTTSIHRWEKLSPCSIDMANQIWKKFWRNILKTYRKLLHLLKRKWLGCNHCSRTNRWRSEPGLDVLRNAFIQICVSIWIEFMLHMNTKHRHWLQIYSPMIHPSQPITSEGANEKSNPLFYDWPSLPYKIWGICKTRSLCEIFTRLNMKNKNIFW